MKKILNALMMAAVLLGSAQAAKADLARVCPVIKNISDRQGIGALVQYKNSQVQRACAALTCPISGFLKSPTIIATQGKNPFRLASATIYNDQGRVIGRSGGRLGCASNRGECLARYKFFGSTTSIRRSARDGIGYVKVATNLCVKVPNLGKCYNVKVRDTCDGRVI